MTRACWWLEAESFSIWLQGRRGCRPRGLPSRSRSVSLLVALSQVMKCSKVRWQNPQGKPIVWRGSPRGLCGLDEGGRGVGAVEAGLLPGGPGVLPRGGRLHSGAREGITGSRRGAPGREGPLLGQTPASGAAAPKSATPPSGNFAISSARSRNAGWRKAHYWKRRTDSLSKMLPAQRGPRLPRAPPRPRA